MSENYVVLTERTRFGGETGAGLMRNRCAFTARDMGADWPDAFTYAVVFGWDDPDCDGVMDSMAAKFGMVCQTCGTDYAAALTDGTPR